MAELSLRPGTSGTLNRAWPDHPCVAVMRRHKIVTMQSKVPERLLVFIVPSLLDASIPQLTWHVVMGEHAMPQIGCEMEHLHTGLIHPGFIRRSDALQCHGTSCC